MTTLTEDKAKLRREKSKEAIALALEGNWEKAVEVNHEILLRIPDDVESLNRLGKALMELGKYSAARGTFERAAKIAPYNTIAKKNLERLAHLQGSNPSPKAGKMVTPYLFIEESGKSGISLLRKPAPSQVLAKMAAGDRVTLHVREHSLEVRNSRDECLGDVDTKLGTRLIRLMNDGNKYEAAVIGTNNQEISVIIWESYRHPSLANVCSFPTRSKEDSKVYWRDALLRYDIDSEPEEGEEELASEWKDGYSGGSAPTDGEDLSEAQFSREPVTAAEGEYEE